MFGLAPGAHTGPQIRGFGVLHDGAVDTVFNFLARERVLAEQRAADPRCSASCSPSTRTWHPIVGQQATLSSIVNNTGREQPRHAC